MDKDIIKTDLTNCEKMIMKLVWDNGDEDIEQRELISQLHERYGKEYARTTVGTFLKKLSEEGYVMTYRKGNFSYTHALISEDAYREYLMHKESHFWFKGKPSQMVAAILHSDDISDEELRKMKELLDQME